jgi:hypothetical protein
MYCPGLEFATSLVKKDGECERKDDWKQKGLETVAQKSSFANCLGSQFPFMSHGSLDHM